MKIRTKEELIDNLSADLGWRKKELTTLHNNVKTANPKSLPTSLRCAVVMLYAHWEGFIKNSAELYLSYIKYQRLNYNQLNPNLLAFSLKQKLNDFTGTQKATLHAKFVDFFQNNLHERAPIPENDGIKTNSNLSSTILKEIFATIGIDITPYELKSNLIDSQLLNYRNNIVHGNYLPVDKVEYDVIYIEVTTMLNQVLTDISNCAVLDKYLR